jgi:hypothetical protein
VVYQLKAPHHDGTTHFVFEPLDFLARLAALVPRPRGNLVRYHGILAPNARHRSRVVPATSGRRRRSDAQARAQALANAHHESGQHPPTAPMTWMERLRRVFAIDLSVCPYCGGRVRVIADVTRPDVIQRICVAVTRHVARQQGPPDCSPSRPSQTVH